MKLRFCHSVWSKPMFSGRWGVNDQVCHNLWMFALSAALIKRAGHSIVLHTDCKGRDLFGFLPYDEVYTTLDTLDSDPLFWASGKVLAQQNEPLGSIHIDGDAFITSPELFTFMKNSKAALLIQHLEYFDDELQLSRPYALAVDALTKALSKVPITFNTSFTRSFNCGFVKFNNQRLKDEYISGYWSFLKAVLCDKEVLKVLSENKDITPDLVLEQLWLHFLVTTNAYTYSCFKSEELLNKGFIHMVGKSKYSNTFWVKRELIKTDISLFYKVNDFLVNNGFKEV